LPTSDPGTGPIPRSLEANPAKPSADLTGSHAGGTHLGDSRVGVSLTLDFSKRLNPAPLVLTATAYTRTTGVLSKSNDDFYDVVGWGGLVEWKVFKGFSAFTEYVHEGRFEEEWPSNTELNDVGLGLAYQFSNGLSLVGGAQWGLLNNGGTPGQFVPDDGQTPIQFKVIGAPDVQVYAGLTWEVGLGTLDPDKDGLMGEFDKCPVTAEDADGFQDSDGCPDTDNDQDGVSDLKDNCPNQPEDVDGFEDADGCPEVDNDQDGILDNKDTCPIEAEDKDGFEDTDGCADLDNDHDGVPDLKDECLNEPQGAGGVKGCPVRDADRDGFVDEKDECPSEKEVVNGYQDQDGCPDKAPIEEKTLVLKGVNFESAKAILTPESYPALEDLVTQLQASPTVELEVSGHTDNRGNAAKNLDLSQARAQAVADFLIQRGVAANRLKVKGYGSSKPLSTNKSAEGRMLNRRVEFNRIK
jgi:outer membrane protein OmpA-like peptidoglycan-associated protein